jgi:hypothetical protein
MHATALAQSARHAHVSALGHEHVGPLFGDPPAHVVRQRKLAHDGARLQVGRVDQLLGGGGRGENRLAAAHRRAHVGFERKRAGDAPV